MEWRSGGAGRGPDPRLLRAHSQVFSRLGWALFAHTAVMLAVQVAMAAAAGLAAPSLLRDPVFQWVLAAFSVYGAGFPTFCLVAGSLPAPPPAQSRPLSPARLLQVWVICMGSTYAVNFLTLALMGLVGALRGAPVENPVEQLTAYPAALSILLTCVIAPVAEELMFRKLLLERLRPYGERFALWISALCFGLFHGNLSQFFYACAIGLALGYVALRTGRVWQPMLLHAMINAVSTILVPLLEPLGGAAVGGLVLGCVGLGAAFLAALRREIRFSAAPGLLPGRWAWRVFFESPGVICFLLLALALCVSWLL